MVSVLIDHDDRKLLSASPVEVDQAREVIDKFTADGKQPPALAGPTGHSETLPPELSDLLRRVLEILSAGGTVTVGAMPENLTTTSAAGLLGVSRPTLMKMIAKGDIAAHKVGSHSRLRTQDVLSLRKTRRDKQREAFDALRAMEDD